jgi:hypothetical protein
LLCSGKTGTRRTAGQGAGGDGGFGPGRAVGNRENPFDMTAVAMLATESINRRGYKNQAFKGLLAVITFEFINGHVVCLLGDRSFSRGS